MLGNELDLQVADEVSAWIDGFKSWRLEHADVISIVQETHEAMTCRKTEGGVAVQDWSSFGVDLFVDRQDGNVGLVTMVFGAVGTTWLVVVGVEDSFLDQEIGVDLIPKLAGDGEEGRWHLCKRACLGLAADCVSCCNALRKTTNTYNASIVLSSTVRIAEEGDGKGWMVYLSKGRLLQRTRQVKQVRDPYVL